ncbi:MAG: hypothetical protein NXI24_09370 [bacterium]|nr:hypothetical protein [bacterium]
MLPIYQEALNGTLKTKTDGVPMDFQFKNATEIPLVRYWVDPQGFQIHPVVIQPGATTSKGTGNSGGAFLFTTEYSGAFVAALRLEEGQNLYEISCDLLCQPNDVGDLPTPRPNQKNQNIIPVDSPSVLVGCNKVLHKNDKRITREQFWKLGDDSFCLGPLEKRAVGYNTTSGMQDTSSSLDTISASVGVSASGGWGAVSASVSSSLNYTSTTFQQVTVSTETTRYESVELENKTDRPQVFYKWQLTDVITIFGDNYKPESSIVRTIQPLLIDGPYKVDGTPSQIGDANA